MICLTLDTDWMRDEEMEEFLETYPDLPPSTFFIHAASGTWRPERHEWGPHPTIDPRDPPHAATWQIEEAPSLGIRSHSCVSSHRLSVEWANAGFLYQSNETQLFGTGSAPIRTAWGIWELPISYMDNMDMWFAKNWPGTGHTAFADDVIATAMSCTQTYVFDFHPIHIAFNSPNPDRYAQLRARHADGASAWSLGSSGVGVRAFFDRVLQAIHEAKVPTACASDIVQHEAQRVQQHP